MKKVYDKLVRDRIPEIIESSGSEPDYYSESNDHAYWMRLISKLHEEVTEFADDGTAEEMADIIELIYTVCEFQKIDLDEVEKVRAQKKFTAGGFNKRYILRTVKE